jgi:hypothetical protein
MLNISQLRLQLAEDGVQATSIARAELTTRVAEYKELGDEARAIVFGSHRKAQAAIVPIDMFNQLLDMAEGVISTPKVAPTKQKVRGAKVEQQITQVVQDSEVQEPAAQEQPKPLAGSNLHIGASTQELLDEIMAKWKL